MVQVLPQEPGLGELLGMGLGQGMGQGIQQQAQLQQAIQLARAKQAAKFEGLQNILGMVSGQGGAGTQNQGTGGTEQAGQPEMSDMGLAALSTVAPEAARIMQTSQQQRTKNEMAREKMNLPKYEELSQSIQNKQLDQLRFNRLDELNKSGNIASPFLAKLAMKDGQLKFPFLFSPETQEMVKIVTDFTSQAKDSYGARITNFDLQTFLQKLPSLLNTSEGRNQIIRNLQTISKINELHDLGIKEAFDESGGIGKISYDEAMRKGEKKYKKQIMELKKEYIKPSSAAKQEKFPSASEYKDKKLKDNVTGKIYISDGKSWKEAK